MEVKFTKFFCVVVLSLYEVIFTSCALFFTIIESAFVVIGGAFFIVMWTFPWVWVFQKKAGWQMRSARGDRPHWLPSCVKTNLVLMGSPLPATLKREKRDPGSFLLLQGAGRESTLEKKFCSNEQILSGVCFLYEMIGGFFFQHGGHTRRCLWRTSHMLDIHIMSYWTQHLDNFVLNRTRSQQHYPGFQLFTFGKSGRQRLEVQSEERRLRLSVPLVQESELFRALENQKYFSEQNRISCFKTVSKRLKLRSPKK